MVRNWINLLHGAGFRTNTKQQQNMLYISIFKFGTGHKL